MGFKALYPEAIFYATHKISKKNLLEQVLSSSADEKVKADLVERLYSDGSNGIGRRGVLPVKEAVSLIKKKIEDKAKFY